MLNDEMAAEDIVQNVFLKFYENIERLRDKDKAKYWLFTTARNEIFNLFRKKNYKIDRFKSADVETIENSGEENPAEILESKELSALIMNRLEKFPPEQKEVYLLKEYGGLSYKEISAVMNTAEEKVKSRLYLARRKLIKEISSKINFNADGYNE